MDQHVVNMEVKGHDGKPSSILAISQNLKPHIN